MAENHALIPEKVMYMKPDALKESKDSSKNLVSGDFERQYKDGMLEQGNGRRHRCVAFATILAVLAAWLLVLTVLREVQITRLRHQVDDLTANMIAATVNIKSLNDRLANNKLFNEFKALEDTIYADEDIDDGKDSEKEHQDSSLEKLHGLTVLEDENHLPDEEDTYDSDGDESGDYMDYDARREKIGVTNMVRLTPEDFTDTVLNFELEKSGIREIKRLLNENPENPNLASSLPSKESTQELRNKRSVISDATGDAVDHFGLPRFVAKPEEKKKTKKFMPVESPATGKAPPHTVTRTVRNSDDEGVHRRPFIAAHFHGNTSHLFPETHEHYKGNGLVRVSHGAAHDVWYPSPWTVASPHPRPTLTRNGHVHVHHTGIYLVYVQIYYLDSHDIISWVLHRTNVDIEGRETLLQCAQSSHSTERLDKPNSCFSAAALFLRAGDRLAVRNTGGDRHSLMQPEKSFIGLIKLADAEDPDQEF